jgi:peptidoglycan/LPS O-acetylase OafA/YrhL
MAPVQAAERVPDAVAPPPRHPRFPLVDGVRAIAAISVLLVHIPGSASLPDPLARLIPQLSVGVTIFFVISGFLLYRPLVAARGGGPARPAFDDYAKRRFLRIYPAYWVALTAFAILPGFSGVDGDGAAAQYSLLHTLPMLGGPACSGFGLCGLAHTGSLVIEVTFYALLPLYALVVARLTRRFTGRAWMRAELAILAACALLSQALEFVFFGGLPTPWIGQTVLGHFFWFSLGMGLAVTSVALSERERWPAPVRAVGAHPGLAWLTAAALFVAVCYWLPERFFAQTQFDRTVASFGFGFVALLVVAPAVLGDREGGLPRRFLAHPAVAWLGLISYGIFLWHFAIANKFDDAPYGLALLGTLAISIAVAALSYYLVERPILRLKYVSIRERLRRRWAAVPLPRS